MISSDPWCSRQTSLSDQSLPVFHVNHMAVDSHEVSSLIFSRNEIECVTKCVPSSAATLDDTLKGFINKAAVKPNFGA